LPVCGEMTVLLVCKWALRAKEEKKAKAKAVESKVKSIVFSSLFPETESLI
jgi:hypothetical protein